MQFATNTGLSDIDAFASFYGMGLNASPHETIENAALNARRGLDGLQRSVVDVKPYRFDARQQVGASLTGGRARVDGRPRRQVLQLGRDQTGHDLGFE
jgi:hypothetical protein